MTSLPVYGAPPAVPLRIRQQLRVDYGPGPMADGQPNVDYDADVIAVLDALDATESALQHAYKTIRASVGEPI